MEKGADKPPKEDEVGHPMESSGCSGTLAVLRGSSESCGLVLFGISKLLSWFIWQWLNGMMVVLPWQDLEARSSPPNASS